MTYYCEREQKGCQYFSQEENIVFCHNVERLLLYVCAVSSDPHDWRLFLDRSKRSLKCVLNHNWNEYASISTGHSVHAKETYKNVKQLLWLIKYADHKSVICMDLKMVSFLFGQQDGYIKYTYFLFMGQPCQEQALDTKK